MNNTIELAFCFFLGILLAGIYFGGLWWTVQSLRRGDRVIGRYFYSFALRLAALCLAFVLILQLGPGQLISAFLGFLLFRMVVIRRFGKTGHLDSPVTD